MSDTWATVLQGCVKTIVCCGSVGFLLWVATNCVLKIMKWYRDK